MPSTTRRIRTGNTSGSIEGTAGPIVAEFQRRRRVTYKIRNYAAAIGVGSIFAGVLLVNVVRNPPLWIVSAIVLAMVIAVVGSFYAPQMYRCPRCGRRVRVPDTTDSGYVMPRDPASCPRCGVTLR